MMAGSGVEDSDRVTDVRSGVDGSYESSQQHLQSHSKRLIHIILSNHRPTPTTAIALRSFGKLPSPQRLLLEQILIYV